MLVLGQRAGAVAEVEVEQDAEVEHGGASWGRAAGLLRLLSPLSNCPAWRKARALLQLRQCGAERGSPSALRSCLPCAHGRSSQSRKALLDPVVADALGRAAALTSCSSVAFPRRGRPALRASRCTAPAPASSGPGPLRGEHGAAKVLVQRGGLEGRCGDDLGHAVRRHGIGLEGVFELGLLGLSWRARGSTSWICGRPPPWAVPRPAPPGRRGCGCVGCERRRQPGRPGRPRASRPAHARRCLQPGQQGQAVAGLQRSPAAGGSPAWRS